MKLWRTSQPQERRVMKQQQVNGNASRELTFRSLMAGLRARKSLNAEEIQELADALSRLWRGKDVLFAARIHRARKMLDSMLDGIETEVITTGVITSRCRSFSVIRAAFSRFMRRSRIPKCLPWHTYTVVERREAAER